MMKKIAYCFSIAICALFISGCASTHYTINEPIARADPSSGYRLQLVEKANTNESMFIHVSFSGGGIRAASLAYGVMEELAQTHIQWQGRNTTLWNEVDIITAVSGGSLPAAYAAAFGDKVFTDFIPEVLEARLQGVLLSDALSVAGLWRLTSPRFGRTDLLERRLNESVFKGIRYKDISSPPRRPFVIISASEMHTGTRFDFTQDRFDELCSDLGSLPLARAVAASSSVPILLSPITFWDYGPECGINGSPSPKRYLHVVDGGLADNLASRTLLDVNQRYGVAAVARRAGYRRLSQVVFIIVNAETSASLPEDSSADVPSVWRSGLALADIPINHFSADTRKQLKAAVSRWQDEARQSAAANGRYSADLTFTPNTTFHLIEVSLQDIADEALRRVSTNLELDASITRSLRLEASRMLRNSPTFRALRAAFAPVSNSQP
jgi:NTE family protein